MTSHYKASVNNGSGIIEEALTIVPCSADSASHFVLSKKNKIKFIIDLKDGKKHLTANVAAYSKGLTLLFKGLPCIPYSLLKCARLGYFAQVTVHPDIAKFIPSAHQWNVLVGTYDDAQKIVLQCYEDTSMLRTFIKVGNEGSAEQIRREIQFLNRAVTYSTFDIPSIQEFCLIDKTHPFNIQVTLESRGEKIAPIFTPQLYAITQELAGEPEIKDGIAYVFSHGDFAPWNIRRTAAGYTVLDWEHCGMRPEGYDAAYFIIMTEVALRHCSFEEAFESAQFQLRTIAPGLQLDYNQIYNEFIKTTKALSF